MKKLTLATIVFLSTYTAAAFADENDRFYLFIGEPSPQAWQFMINNPGDREAAVKDAIANLGGELLSYYWGVNTAKNYITVRLPADGETVPAMLIARLSTGLLVSYEAVELMPSSRMPDVVRRIEEISEVDDVPLDNQDGSE